MQLAQPRSVITHPSYTVSTHNVKQLGLRRQLKNYLKAEDYYALQLPAQLSKCLPILNLIHDPHPRSPFPGLPIELRQEIWNLTLTPCIICLHIHRRIALPFIDEQGYKRGRNTTAVSFTSTIL